MFEVLYHYHEKINNEYDKSQIKEMTKRVGKAFEEVPLEKLAGTIISQLARRDIWVLDIDVYEYTKKKINFKETKGGIVLKNKKFTLDGTVEFTEDISEDIPTEIQQAAQFAQRPQVYEKQPNQAIRWEVFDPDPPIAAIMAKRFNLTPKRKYPILEEKTVIQRINLHTGGTTEMPGYEYLIIDDTGARIKAPAIHFTPERKGLIGMENMPTTERDYANAPKLMHMENYSDPNMPTLRR